MVEDDRKAVCPVDNNSEPENGSLRNETAIGQPVQAKVVTAGPLDCHTLDDNYATGHIGAEEAEKYGMAMAKLEPLSSFCPSFCRLVRVTAAILFSVISCPSSMVAGLVATLSLFSAPIALCTVEWAGSRAARRTRRRSVSRAWRSTRSSSSCSCRRPGLFPSRCHPS